MTTQAPELLYLANCGVLLRHNGTSLLLDGLITDSALFDRIPKTAETLLIEGCEPYSHVDLLVFSHLHFDHFSLVKTLRFLEHHPETKLLVPGALRLLIEQPDSCARYTGSPSLLSDSAAVSKDGYLQDPFEGEYTREEAAAILSARTIYMDSVEGTGTACGSCWEGSGTACGSSLEAADRKPGFLSVGSIQLSYLRTGHITYDYPQHYCIKAACGGCEFFFGSDMDFEQLSAAADALNLRGRPHLTAFFNPLLLGRTTWAEVAASWMPERVFIYHLPPESSEQCGIRTLALRRAPRINELLPQLELLTEPMQWLSLSL